MLDKGPLSVKHWAPLDTVTMHADSTYSRPPNTAALGTGDKTAVLENGNKGFLIYNQEKHIRDLKISSGIGGEAVNGEAVLGGGGGGDCISGYIS